MEISETDFKRLENKIDKIIINYNFKQNNQLSTDERKKKNRIKLEKILFVIPKFEKLIEKKTLTSEQLQELTDCFLEKQLMGTKNKENAEKFTSYTSEIQNTIKMKIFLENAYEILDNYLALEYQPIFFNSKKSDWQMQDTLEMKKAILKYYYGYKIDENEETCKTTEELSEKLGINFSNTWKKKQELLDDLAPDFFGLDGLYL